MLLSRPGSDLILSKKTADTELTLENLETFTSYYIKVAAYTKVGSGVRSDKMICTTAQDGENFLHLSHYISWEFYLPDYTTLGLISPPQCQQKINL